MFICKYRSNRDKAQTRCQQQKSKLMRSILRIGETAMRLRLIKHLPKKDSKRNSIVFGNKDTHFIPRNPIFHGFYLCRIFLPAESPLRPPRFQVRFRFTAPTLHRGYPGRVHIFCIFVRREPDERNKQTRSDDEKNTRSCLLLTSLLVDRPRHRSAPHASRRKPKSLPPIRSTTTPN